MDDVAPVVSLPIPERTPQGAWQRPRSHRQARPSAAVPPRGSSVRQGPRRVSRRSKSAAPRRSAAGAAPGPAAAAGDEAAAQEAHTVAQDSAESGAGAPVISSVLEVREAGVVGRWRWHRCKIADGNFYGFAADDEKLEHARLQVCLDDIDGRELDEAHAEIRFVAYSMPVRLRAASAELARAWHGHLRGAPEPAAPPPPPSVFVQVHSVVDHAAAGAWATCAVEARWRDAEDPSPARTAGCETSDGSVYKICQQLGLCGQPGTAVVVVTAYRELGGSSSAIGACELALGDDALLRTHSQALVDESGEARGSIRLKLKVADAAAPPAPAPAAPAPPLPAPTEVPRAEAGSAKKALQEALAPSGRPKSPRPSSRAPSPRPSSRAPSPRPSSRAPSPAPSPRASSSAGAPPAAPPGAHAKAPAGAPAEDGSSRSSTVGSEERGEDRGRAEQTEELAAEEQLTATPSQALERLHRLHAEHRERLARLEARRLRALEADERRIQEGIVENRVGSRAAHSAREADPEKVTARLYGVARGWSDEPAPAAPAVKVTPWDYNALETRPTPKLVPNPHRCLPRELSEDGARTRRPSPGGGARGAAGRGADVAGCSARTRAASASELASETRRTARRRPENTVEHARRMHEQAMQKLDNRVRQGMQWLVDELKGLKKKPAADCQEHIEKMCSGRLKKDKAAKALQAAEKRQQEAEKDFAARCQCGREWQSNEKWCKACHTRRPPPQRREWDPAYLEHLHADHSFKMEEQRSHTAKSLEKEHAAIFEQCICGEQFEGRGRCPRCFTKAPRTEDAEQQLRSLDVAARQLKFFEADMINREDRLQRHASAVAASKKMEMDQCACGYSFPLETDTETSTMRCPQCGCLPLRSAAGRRPRRSPGATEDRAIAHLVGAVEMRCGVACHHDALREVSAPLRAAMKAYATASKLSSRNAGAAMLREMESMRIFGDGMLVDDARGCKVGIEPDPIRQLDSDLDALMETAQAAQRQLLMSVAGRTSRDGPLPWPEGGRWPAPGVTKHAAFAYNPGPKPQRAAESKAYVLYAPADPSRSHRHLLDLARVSLVFESCDALRSGVLDVCRAFEVLDIRNRYRPGASGLLGERFVEVLVVAFVETAAGFTPFVCEIRLEELCFFKARAQARPHVDALCSVFRKAFGAGRDVDAVDYVARCALVTPLRGSRRAALHGHMAHRFGSTVWAWRFALGGGPLVTFRSFQDAYLQVGSREACVEAWQMLDPGRGGCVSLFDLDPEAVFVLLRLRDALVRATRPNPTAEEVLRRLTSMTHLSCERPDSVSFHMFRSALKLIGFSRTECQRAFQLLDGGSRRDKFHESMDPSGATVHLNDIRWLLRLPQIVDVDAVRIVRRTDVDEESADMGVAASLRAPPPPTPLNTDRGPAELLKTSRAGKIRSFTTPRRVRPDMLTASGVLAAGGGEGGGSRDDVGGAGLGKGQRGDEDSGDGGLDGAGGARRGAPARGGSDRSLHDFEESGEDYDDIDLDGGLGGSLSGSSLGLAGAAEDFGSSVGSGDGALGAGGGSDGAGSARGAASAELSSATSAGAGSWGDGHPDHEFALSWPAAWPPDGDQHGDLPAAPGDEAAAPRELVESARLVARGPEGQFLQAQTYTKAMMM